jgi:uncharacterized membrane protein YjgN (DUF898 family)
VRHEVEFRGSGGEYFKIWIVNLALTIATLGIFSAWAKVRSKRYFCGNTFIAGHSFDYHGKPIRILIGRLIALGLLLLYVLSTAFLPLLAAAWAIVLFFALPWLARASFRFNARNTSYRNTRFDFHGSYWDAMRAFLLWPILAAITLFTTWPLAHRARYYYQINSHSFGGRNFQTAIPAGRMYLIYLAAFGIILAALALLFCLILLLGFSLMALDTQLEPGAGNAPLSLLIMTAYAALFFFLYIFVGTKAFNLAVNGTRLGEDFALEAGLSPLAVAWIAFSNLVLVLVTLGLFTPWAHVRATRYLVRHMAVTGSGSADSFVDSAARADSAVGEEVAGFFDFDFSL